jgi:L-threonylcarbamoyladenylate synthase
MSNNDKRNLGTTRAEQVANALRAGGIAILPTDTVYGVVASVLEDEAVRRLYAAKGKGESAPLQLLFAPGDGFVEKYAELTSLAARFIEAVGPGGWTAIVPVKAGWDSPALAGGRTVGVRVPDAVFVHEVVRALGCPVAASSANRHGGPSPRTYTEAVAGLGHACAEAVDGGELAGIDSTVIDFASAVPRILREGAIARETVARILGLDSIEVLRSVRS